MTFTEFCEKQEITEECCKDTLDICAKINPHLKEFLKKYTYRELPCFYIKQFLEEYNYSKVNTKTGEILEPTELLPKIYPKIVDNISFTLNTEYHPSPYDKYMPVKLVIIGLDKNGVYVNNCSSSSRKTARDGLIYMPYSIEETIDGTMFQKERIVIDLNNLYKTTEELLVCVFNTNPSAEVISSIFNVEPITHYPNLSYIRTPDLPVVKKLKASEGIIAYRVKKEVNEWNCYRALEPINKSEKEFIEFLDF